MTSNESESTPENNGKEIDNLKAEQINKNIDNNGQKEPSRLEWYSNIAMETWRQGKMEYILKIKAIEHNIDRSTDFVISGFINAVIDRFIVPQAANLGAGNRISELKASVEEGDLRKWIMDAIGDDFAEAIVGRSMTAEMRNDRAEGTAQNDKRDSDHKSRPRPRQDAQTSDYGASKRQDQESDKTAAGDEGDGAAVKGRPWPDGAGLQGGLQQVLLTIRERTRDFDGRPDRVERFLLNELLPTMDRFQVNRLGTPETLTDLLMFAIRGVEWGPSTPLGSVENARKLVDCIWEELRQQVSKGSGFYQTVISITMWFDRIVTDEDVPNKWFVISCLHAICDLSLSEKTGNGGRKLIDDVDEYLEWLGGAVNNLSANIAGLARSLTITAKEPEAFAKTISALQAYAVALRLLMKREPVKEDRVTLAGELFNAMEWPVGMEQVGVIEAPNKFGKLILSLVDMANVTSAWENVHPGVLDGPQKDMNPEGDLKALNGVSLFIAARAGIVRMVVCEADDLADVAAAFFNAGVNTMRYAGGGKSRGQSSDRSVRLRIALNAIGLMWALSSTRYDENYDKEQSNLDREVVWGLSRLNGLDCAVNMYGALVDLKENHPSVAGEEPWSAVLNEQEAAAGDARKLFDFLRYYHGRVPAEERIEYERLAASWRRLSFLGQKEELRSRPNIKDVPSIEQVMSFVQTIFNAAVGLSPGSLVPPNTEKPLSQQRAWMMSCAVRLDRLLCEVVGAEKSVVIGNLSLLMQSISAWSGDIEAAYVKLYRGLAGAEIEKMLMDNNVPTLSLERKGDDGDWHDKEPPFALKLYEILTTNK